MVTVTGQKQKNTVELVVKFYKFKVNIFFKNNSPFCSINLTIPFNFQEKLFYTISRRSLNLLFNSFYCLISVRIFFAWLRTLRNAKGYTRLNSKIVYNARFYLCIPNHSFSIKRKKRNKMVRNAKIKTRISKLSKKFHVLELMRKLGF
jgi:hypothetical protein